MTSARSGGSVSPGGCSSKSSIGPNLNSLPAEPYSFAEWRLRRVGVDYHVELEQYKPARVQALIETTKQIASELRPLLGNRLRDTPTTGQIAADDILAGALEEIRRSGNASWAWGVMIYAPASMPLDYPALAPLNAAAAEFDLAVVLHTFTVMPPYAPGGEDTWDNLWLQRSAAHPRCGMRNMAAVIGSGVLDRYPS
jgi:hypothetical protein